MQNLIKTELFKLETTISSHSVTVIYTKTGPNDDPMGTAYFQI